jgi:hypothetical protein
MSNHLSDDDLILHFYGETERGQAAWVESHLASCADCQDARAALVRVMTLVDSAAPVEAPPGYERTAWARLEPQLPPSGGAPRWTSSLFWFPQWALGGAVAALVIVAFVAGRVSGGDPPIAAPTQAVVDDGEPSRVLEAEVGDHLDRTQMMLVELVNAETDHSDVLAGEQARASDLVAINRLIRQSAEQSGDSAIVSVLEDLERVLLEIANAPAGASSNELTDLQSRITTEDLLFRLRVIASEMRQRTNSDREAGDPTARRMPRS